MPEADDRRDQHCVAHRFPALRGTMITYGTGDPLDTAAPTATGVRRADADVPLSAVMAAYRVSVHALWAAVIELTESHPDISSGQLLAATAVLWDVQDAYTDAMTAAYREQAIQRAVADETERAALTEALTEARVFDTVPEGTQVMIINTFNHRDQTRIPYADRFEPTAWADPSVSSSWSFNFFSHGPQQCPGADLALQLGIAFLAALLRDRQPNDINVTLDPRGSLPLALDQTRIRISFAPRRRR